MKRSRRSASTRMTCASFGGMRLLPMAVACGVVMAASACGRAPAPQVSAAPHEEQITDTAAARLPAETKWPAITLVAEDPSRPGVHMRRDVVGVRFRPGTDAVTILGVFRRFRATIIGSTGVDPTMDYYIVQLPDPGPSFEAVMEVFERISREAGVMRIYPFRDSDRIQLRNGAKQQAALEAPGHVQLE